MDTRKQWVASLTRIAYPVLFNLSKGTLRANMPVAGMLAKERECCTHLEALGRTLCGLAPWLASQPEDEEEKTLQRQFAAMARDALSAALDPQSPDCLEFAGHPQCLVDAAFLCHGMVRAMSALWEPLPPVTRQRLISQLRATRKIKPGPNNWLLFSAIVEMFFYLAGEDWDSLRVDYALRQHDQWYKGDGLYGDGEPFHMDYYNSFVIQPMLIDVLRILPDNVDGYWNDLRARALARGRRYAAILERLIAPDGSYPVFGRSVCYRYGAFQHLAQMALMDNLPQELSPAQVRCALDAVRKKVESYPAMYDEQGWLNVGVAGCQPGLGEGYISTGSLYLCTTLFLPLGLNPGHAFWSGGDVPFSGQRMWNGDDMSCDHAI